MKLRDIVDLFKASIIGWMEHEATLHAAALAYYTIFSLAPLVILSVTIAAQVFSRSAVEGKVVAVLQDIVGAEAAGVVQEIIEMGNDRTAGYVATGITALFSLYGASVVFRQVRYSLNAIWGVTPKTENIQQSIMAVIKEFAVAVTAVLSVGFILLASLLLNALWTAVPEKYLQVILPNLDTWMSLFRFVASPIIFTVIFALVFKSFPTAKTRWRDMWLGAAVTALLFWLGGYLIGLYLAYSAWTSIYGAAGSLIAFLLWIYYSAWIFLFGAKFTQVYAARYGEPIVPA